MAPRSWHPGNCSRRFTWAKSGNLGHGREGAFLTHSSPNQEELWTRRGGRGRRAHVAGASEAKRTNPRSTLRTTDPSARGVPRSPRPPARPQNYLLPRSPQAKSEEVHSWWRPVRGGWNTSFNPNYPASRSLPLPRRRTRGAA